MNTDSPVHVTDAARSSTISTGDGDGGVNCRTVELGCLDMEEEDAVRIPEAPVAGVESRPSTITGVASANGSVFRLETPGDLPLAWLGA